MPGKGRGTEVAEGGFWKKLTNFFTASEEDEDIIEEDYMDEGYEAEEVLALYLCRPEPCSGLDHMGLSTKFFLL